MASPLPGAPTGAPVKTTVDPPEPFAQVPLFDKVVDEPEVDLVIVNVLAVASEEVNVASELMVNDPTVAAWFNVRLCAITKFAVVEDGTVPSHQLPASFQFPLPPLFVVGFIEIE